MAISVGARLPDAQLLTMGADGPETVALGQRLEGRKVALFGLPGAFTGTCSTAHVPSFVRSMGPLREKGVEDVICIAVNDPFVMKAWGEATGATAAGITMLADAEGTFTRAIGLDFSAPQAGLIGRTQRFTMLAEDGVVRILNLEESRGVCEVTAAETLVHQL